MGVREITGYEQFLLFQQCFQKTFIADMYKQQLMWESARLKKNSDVINFSAKNKTGI